MLIIGSEGFIGKNALAYFRGKGYSVTGADIMLLKEEGYIYINSNCSDFNSLFSLEKFDVCINASGAANVQSSFDTPHRDFLLNTVNVYSFLLAIKNNCPECKFINLSSAAVYGNPKAIPISELHELNPISPYGFHKFQSELICREFFEIFGIQSLSLRVFSAYGEGLKKQLFWDIYQKIKSSTNNTIQLFGTGKETRDFIYIKDLIRAIDCIIDKATFNGNVINIASGVSVEIQEVAKIFVKNYQPSLEVVFTSKLKQGDPSFWVADISKLSAMGFIPQYSIENGIKNYLLWLGEKA